MRPNRNLSGVLTVAGAIVALLAAIGLQMARDRRYHARERDVERILYVRSGEVAKRVALEFDALAADIYWIRAIQHYGGDRLAGQKGRKYDLLFPLLDLTTTLDPYFTIAYRFGAIFLSEGYPGGPGQPDQAITLLRKGIAVQPTKWQYYHDIAFVNYWQLQDYSAASSWFLRAAAQPNAPNWLAPVAASMLSAGDNRAAARFLWQQVLQADQEWLRNTARRSLMQLDALDAIDQLRAIVRRFPPAAGAEHSWEDLIRRSVLRGVPLDPSGTPFEIDPVTGDVSVSTKSALYPMPARGRRPPS